MEGIFRELLNDSEEQEEALKSLKIGEKKRRLINRQTNTRSKQNNRRTKNNNRSSGDNGVTGKMFKYGGQELQQ